MAIWREKREKSGTRRTVLAESGVVGVRERQTVRGERVAQTLSLSLSLSHTHTHTHTHRVCWLL